MLLEFEKPDPIIVALAGDAEQKQNFLDVCKKASLFEWLPEAKCIEVYVCAGHVKFQIWAPADLKNYPAHKGCKAIICFGMDDKFKTEILKQIDINQCAVLDYDAFNLEPLDLLEKVKDIIPEQTACIEAFNQDIKKIVLINPENPRHSPVFSELPKEINTFLTQLLFQSKYSFFANLVKPVYVGMSPKMPETRQNSILPTHAPEEEPKKEEEGFFSRFMSMFK